MKYEEITLGVYIQATDGSLVKENSWDGSKTPNGICVLTENCRFVIALQDSSSDLEMGGCNKVILNIVTAEEASEAITDYNGYNNTNEIISQLKDYTDDDYGIVGSPAAEACKSFTFPNGQNGYIGAAGEWQAVIDNKSTIESALNKVGGEPIASASNTSTQKNSTYFWRVVLAQDRFTSAAKYSTFKVRPFTTI